MVIHIDIDIDHPMYQRISNFSSPFFEHHVVIHL